jgi:hypothetical protein
VQRKEGFLEFLTPESLNEKKLSERSMSVTFDRSVAIRNSQAEFFALGHPFIDAMLQQIGDYGFGGHTAVRLIELPASQKQAGAKAGYQFNFTVRRRVQREDSDEYLFDFYTIVISPDGTPDDQLASFASALYSKDELPPASARTLLSGLEQLSVDDCFPNCTHTARAKGSALGLGRRCGTDRYCESVGYSQIDLTCTSCKRI